MRNKDLRNTAERESLPAWTIASQIQDQFKRPDKNFLKRLALQARIAESSSILRMRSSNKSPYSPAAIKPRTALLATLLIVLLSACATPPGKISRISSPDVSDSEAATALSSSQVESIFQAMTLIGIPYRNGGASPDTGFDCSGLVRYVFRHSLGLNLPHNSEEIGRMGESLAPEQLQAGDLVFYNTQGKANSHVGIYLGDGRFIHAPSERGVVRIENMALPYWTKRYDGARRLQM